MASKTPFATGRSFSELGSMLEVNPKQELFEKNLKGKFDRVSGGNFKLDLPGVESVSITPLPAKQGQKPAIYATIFYRTQGGKEASTTWTILEDGVISGQVPNALDISKERLEQAILETIGNVNVNFWHQTDLDILSMQDSQTETIEETETPLADSANRPVIDLKRLEFLQKQPQSLFGFVSRDQGFNGYHGAIFPSFVVLEHPKTKNAAFIVDLPEKVSLNASAAKALPDREKDVLVKKLWGPISEKANTRKQLKGLGAKKIVHTEGTWQERMQREIDQRLAS